MTNVGASSSGTAAAGKGKGISRASTITIGAATKTARTQSTKTNTGVEVVCEDGKVVKLKGPTQYVWSHGEKYGNGFTCYYCETSIAGGGATRFRQHLGGVSGNVTTCDKVPPYISKLMADEVVKRTIRNKKNKDLQFYVQRELIEASKNYGMHGSTTIPPTEEAQIQMAMRESLREHALQHGSPMSIGNTSGSGAASCSANRQTTINRFYQSSPSSSKAPFDMDLARSRTQVQPRVDIMLTEGARDKLGLAWAKWFHANDIPGRKADCPYFRSAVKLSQDLGKGVYIPHGREIDGPLLDMNYDDVEAHLTEFKNDWDEYGVTIMCDSWTGPTMMSIINFMIFCNGRMFFHKSVDATGCIQNSDFIFDILKEVVVAEVGIKYVVQIITDNGSNYKKACRLLIQEYPHISWQPCAAHTINLMLKDLGQYPIVQHIVDSAKRICRFLYKHNRLHAMMKEKIGGELIRWNATRFGTIYLFLQSFWDRKDNFKLWMASKDWENCAWAGEDNHEYTESCITQKAAALDPETIYTSDVANHQWIRNALTLAVKKLARSPAKASAAIDQYILFRKKGKLFGGEAARRSAVNGRVSPADWWVQYGGDYPDLQYFAKRIVSQCMSSSGCERNWSTFALIHTKLRNRLSYDKLHKLVYVHYNLKLRIQQFESEMQSLQDMQSHHELDADPCSILMDCAMYDENNPIMDWLCNSRSESAPTLDEDVDSEPGEPNNPSEFVVEELGMDEDEVAAFKEDIFGKKSGKKRKQPSEKEDSANDSESDSMQRSPPYAESGDSSSDDGGDDDDDGAAGGATIGGTSVKEECADGGDTKEKTAPLRPRSQRVKRVSCLYKHQK